LHKKRDARHPESKLTQKPTILEDDGSEWWEKKGRRTEPCWSLCSDQHSHFRDGSENCMGRVKTQSWLNEVTCNLAYRREIFVKRPRICSLPEKSYESSGISKGKAQLRYDNPVHHQTWKDFMWQQWQ